MPFKSKAQARKFFAMEASGELPKGKAEEWAAETPNLESLPERKRTGKRKKTTAKEAYLRGYYRALAGR